MTPSLHCDRLQNPAESSRPARRFAPCWLVLLMVLLCAPPVLALPPLQAEGIQLKLAPTETVVTPGPGAEAVAPGPAPKVSPLDSPLPTETPLPEEPEAIAPAPEQTATPPLPTPEPSGFWSGLTALRNDVTLLVGGGLLFLLLLGIGGAWLVRRARKSRRTQTVPLPAAPVASTEAGAHLSFQGVTIPLPPEGLRIGRASDNDLVITERFEGWRTVSRHHARIYRKGRLWVLEDQNSRNGVYINGQRTGLNLLQDGWQLSLGKVHFTFHSGNAGGRS